jgi:hypothetical protein
MGYPIQLSRRPKSYCVSYCYDADKDHSVYQINDHITLVTKICDKDDFKRCETEIESRACHEVTKYQIRYLKLITEDGATVCTIAKLSILC